MLKRIYFLLIFLFLSPSFSEAGIRERVFETILPNGLKVILVEDHKVPLITFQVWYRVGSRNEKWGKTGLSHVLEHMMFKGTEKVGPEEFSKIVQENGGNLNPSPVRLYGHFETSVQTGRWRLTWNRTACRTSSFEGRFPDGRMVVMEERRPDGRQSPGLSLRTTDGHTFQIILTGGPSLAGWKISASHS
jgi:zinc protease